MNKSDGGRTSKKPREIFKDVECRTRVDGTRNFMRHGGGGGRVTRLINPEGLFALPIVVRSITPVSRLDNAACRSFCFPS